MSAASAASSAGLAECYVRKACLALTGAMSRKARTISSSKGFAAGSLPATISQDGQWVVSVMPPPVAARSAPSLRKRN
jgi:hypothetical protein